MIDLGLEGKTVLVTGGNNPRGIGAATAMAFADQGAAVFIHYFRQTAVKPPDADSSSTDKPGLPLFFAMQAKSADEVVQTIRKRGGRAASWEADLSDPGVVSTLFEHTEEALGPVDVLVNNACDYEPDTFVPIEPGEGGDHAVWEQGPLMGTLSARTHDRHFAVNTRAVALAMVEFARRHVTRGKRWGRIVNVSADCSWGCPSEISYRASKHALESYSRSAAAELGPYGITVNVVAPGPVQTGYISPDMEEQLRASIPLGRVGTPEDIANVIVFLASDQAGWTTGQVITVHGGHRMAPGL